MRTKILSLPIILIALSPTALPESPAVYAVGTTASLRVWVHSEAKLSINGHPIEVQDSGHGYRLLTLPGLSPRQLKKITVAIAGGLPVGTKVVGDPASVWVRPGGGYDIVFATPAPDGAVATDDAKAGKVQSSAQAKTQGSESSAQASAEGNQSSARASAEGNQSSAQSSAKSGQSSAKSDDAKSDEAKDAGAKDAGRKDADPKADDPKDADPKDADPKDADPKDADPKDGDPKDAEDGEAGADAPPAPQPEEPAAEESPAGVEPLPPDTQAKPEEVPAPEPAPIEGADDSSE